MLIKHLNKLENKHYFAQLMLFSLAVMTYLVIFLPSSLHLDSLSMYQDALNLRYVDYWPPLTLLVWHYLSLIKPGGDLMLLLNFTLLWVACYMGLKNFKEKKLSYIFIFIPFVPSIFIDAGEILKDTIFSFGYMFLAMILTQKTLKKTQLSWWEGILIYLGIFYFSMVKIQAQFIFPFFTLWITWLIPSISYVNKKINFFFKFFTWVFLTLSIFLSMNACSNYLIKKQDNAHFWQYVKIYDLAGTSVMANKMYVPSFLWRHSEVTVKNLAEHYDYLWEPLIRYPTSPLVRTNSDEERILLIKAWNKTVLEDPLSYLKHRFRLWIKILGGSPMKGKYLEWTKNYPSLQGLAPFFSLFSFLPFLPLFLYLWWIGLKNLNRNLHAIPLFILSSMGLTLIFILFIFSLAAAARYIYFSWCCFMFCLPFAGKLIYLKKNDKKLLTAKENSYSQES